MAPFKEETSISPIIKASLTVETNESRHKCNGGRIITAKVAGAIYYKKMYGRLREM